jgi:Zn-dependent M16 (insulinase) family peptidase
MEVHVGSIDEEEDEQGIAHMIEHVAFLGSKKRERLLGTGARSNAYTDFHHTVFHIHSPTKTKVLTLCLSQCQFWNWILIPGGLFKAVFCFLLAYFIWKGHT